MWRNWIGRAFGAAMDDSVVAAVTTAVLLLVGGVVSVLLIAVATARTVVFTLCWLSGIRRRGASNDNALSW
jgi:hypothetical protein